MLLDDALHRYRAGWCIVPLHPRSKKPALRHWRSYQNKRPAIGTLRKWFGPDKDVGIAVVLGPVSGNLCCRDFDSLEAYDAWQTKHPHLARTLPQSITSRGRHVYFRCPPGHVESVSPNGATIVDYGDGELRGGGLAVLPPSIHQSGHVYRWQIEPGDVVPVVDDLNAAGLTCCWAASDSETSACDAPRGGHFTDENRSNRGGLKTTDGTEESKCQGSRGQFATDSPDFSKIGDAVEDAILKTLPTGPGQRNKAIFEFARHLKAIDVLRDAEALQLRSIVTDWHRRALDVVKTRSPEESLADFVRAWGKVRIAAGESPMARLFVEAAGSDVPECGKKYPTSNVRLLVAFCKRLGESWKPRPFPLACRIAGDWLNVSHTTANSWLFLLESDGILKLHSKGSQKPRRANRYFYTGD